MIIIKTSDKVLRISALGRHAPTENALRNLEHVAVAIVLGAIFYVRSGTTICRWIDEYRPAYLVAWSALTIGGGETCGLEGEEGHAAEDRGARDDTLFR